jgi:hypothetical protein
MLSQEERRTVEGLIGLVEDAREELEHMAHTCRTVPSSSGMACKTTPR